MGKIIKVYMGRRGSGTQHGRGEREGGNVDPSLFISAANQPQPFLVLHSLLMVSFNFSVLKSTVDLSSLIVRSAGVPLPTILPSRWWRSVVISF